MFNAAYSPELNPIENVFGVWKQRAERDVRSFDGLRRLLGKIVAEFETIELNFVLASFERCPNEVWPRVFATEDLESIVFVVDSQLNIQESQTSPWLFFFLRGGES